MAIGRTGSFATTQAPTDNILQSMQYVDQLDYRAKQDQAKADAAKAAAKSKQDEEFNKDLEKARAVTTGNRGYDAPVIDAVRSLADKMANDYMNLSSGKLSTAEYNVKKNNLLSQVDLLKQKSEGINKNYGIYNEMLKAGKLEDGFDEGVLGLGKAIDNGHVTSEVDENGNVIMIAWEVDENNKPIRIIEKTPLAEFGNSKLTPVTKIEFQKDIEQFKKNNELGLQESLGYNTKTGIKELKKGSNIDRNIIAFSKAKVKDPNFLKVAYRNATGETIYDAEEISKDPEKVKKAEDWAYNQLFDSYSKEVTKDEAASRARLQEEKRKNKEEEKDKKASFGQVEVPSSITSAGYQSKEGYKAVSVRNGRPFNILAGQTFATVNSYTVTTDGTGKERIVAEIVYPDIKTSSLTPQEQNALDKLEKNPESLTESEKLVVSRVTTGAVNKTKIVTLDEADSDKLAGQIGLNNPKEVRDAAKYKDVNEKSEREKWDDAYNKGPKKGTTKTEAENLGI